MEYKKERVLFIDFARGITMLTILWGHVMLTGVTNIIVYAFHIPVFFFLSGMVFKAEKYPTFFLYLKRRVHTLLIPYVFFSIVTWIWYLGDCISKGIPLNGSWWFLVQTFIAQGSGGYLVHNPALWFVTCLFVVEMMYYYINKLSVIGNVLISIIISFCGWLMMQPNPFFDFKLLPWNIEVAGSAMIFYSLGNQFTKYVDYKKVLEYAKSNHYIMGSSIVISFFLFCKIAILNGHVSMAQGVLGKHGLLFYIIACLGIVMMLGLCIFLESIYGYKKWINRVLDYFAWMGKHSFYMMVFHIPFMLVCVRIVSIVSGKTLTEVRHDYRYTLPAWIGMVMGCTILIYIIEKIKKK